MGLNSIVNEAVQANNTVGEVSSGHKNNVLLMVVVLLLQLVLNALIGQFLWNESLVKLIPALSKARWWDTLALSVLLLLVLPQ